MPESIAVDMRRPLTREILRELMQELAKTAPRAKSYRVYVVGGGTAVEQGWRPSTIDADLYSAREDVFRDVQGIKDRLHVNIEFARPEDFVPMLKGSKGRHVFIETFGNVQFYHYDPYAQLLSKIVRGFRRDVQDAEKFLASGMVDPERFRELVQQVPESAFTKYPALSRAAVIEAVDSFLARPRP